MRPIAILLLASGMIAGPAWAEDDDPEKPFTEEEITAVDVAATPVTDLNLRKRQLPAQLVAAQQKPYDMAGLSDCANIAAQVGELDAILGEDIDLPQDGKRRMPSAGRLAQWAVGSFIPFRGAIREISGANEHQRRMAVAIQAGIARRAFLKGVGEAKGCLYPARSATAEVLAAREAERQKLAEAKSPRRKPTGRGETSAAQLTLASEGDRKP